MDNDDLPLIEETDPVLYRASPAMFRADPLRFVFLCGIMVIALVSPFIWPLSIALSVGGIVLPLVALGIWFFKTIDTSVTITKDYVLVTTGIFDKDVTQIFIKDITKFRCYRKFWERIMQVGRIEISSSASAETEIQINDMPYPDKIIQVINANR